MGTTRRDALRFAMAGSLGAPLAAPIFAAKGGKPGGLTLPVMGELTQFAGQTGQFVAVGYFHIDRFVSAAAGTANAVGELKVNIFQRDPVTNLLTLLQTIIQEITAVLSANATCTVLELTLGPLDLSLLGLNIHLDQVHLLITADPTGGILGQLLCSLAGLNLLEILNRILGLFPTP
jgi:hypothetical protein